MTKFVYSYYEIENRVSPRRETMAKGKALRTEPCHVGALSSGVKGRSLSVLLLTTYPAD